MWDLLASLFFLINFEEMFSFKNCGIAFRGVDEREKTGIESMSSVLWSSAISSCINTECMRLGFIRISALPDRSTYTGVILKTLMGYYQGKNRKQKRIIGRK